MKVLLMAASFMVATYSFAFEAGSVQFKGQGHLKSGEEQKEYRVTVDISKEESGEINMVETYIFSEDHQKQLAFTLIPGDREGCFGVFKDEEQVGRGCCKMLPERGLKECHMGLNTENVKAKRRMVFDKENKTLARSGVTRKEEKTIFWRDRLRAVPGEESRQSETH